MKHTINLLIIFSLFFMVFNSCIHEKNEQPAALQGLVEKYIEYWNTGKFDGIENILSENFELRMTPQFKPEKGIEAFKESVLYWRTAYPDFLITIDEIIYTNDAAAGRWTITATNTGEGSHPPTGKSVNVPGMSIIHFTDGKIKDEWIASNNYYWLQQLGYTLAAPKVTEEGE